MSLFFVSVTVGIFDSVNLLANRRRPLGAKCSLNRSWPLHTVKPWSSLDNTFWCYHLGIDRDNILCSSVCVWYAWTTEPKWYFYLDYFCRCRRPAAQQTRLSPLPQLSLLKRRVRWVVFAWSISLAKNFLILCIRPVSTKISLTGRQLYMLQCNIWINYCCCKDLSTGGEMIIP